MTPAEIIDSLQDPIMSTFHDLVHWKPLKVIQDEDKVALIATAHKLYAGKMWTKVYYLAVHESARGRGIGKKLLDSLVGDVLYVTTASNTGANALCQSLNFVEVERRHNAFDSIDVYYTRSKMQDTTKNNGGPTNYYDCDPNWKGAGDIIEGRKMTFNQGTMFKVCFCFNVGRHSATDYERELNKLIYFAKRELKRIEHGN